MNEIALKEEVDDLKREVDNLKMTIWLMIGLIILIGLVVELTE